PGRASAFWTSRTANTCWSCTSTTPARLRPASSAHTRETMYSTESTMFLSPSLLTCPCGRWAALPQIGRSVSTRRLSQYIASSMRGLPWVRTAPVYFPLAGVHRSRRTRQRSPRGPGPEVIGAIRKELPPAHPGRDVPLPDVGAEPRGEALRVAGRWDHAVKVDLGARRDEVADPLVADAEPI